MSLEGTLNVSDGSYTDEPLTGELSVVGLELRHADVGLNGTDVRVVLRWEAGAWQLCRGENAAGAIVAGCQVQARAQ